MKAKREIDIMLYMKKTGVAKIEELSSMLGVSKNTVRRDLQSLEKQGAVVLKHGGAVLNLDESFGMPLDDREIQYKEQKRRIGEKANSLIDEGMSILLDAGTTTEQIAISLVKHRRKGLTVVSNGLNILKALSDSSDIICVSTGGVLNPITRCFTGFNAEQFLSQFHVNMAFLSAGGLTLEGVTNTNALEIQMKKKMLQIADKVVLVITHEKLGTKSLASYARIEDFDALITDEPNDTALIKEIEKKGVQVIRA